jgi:DNA repair exonuclease SbcCD ATPase subunit
LKQKEDILNSRATTPKTEKSQEAQINKVQDDMTGEGTVHKTREEEEVCPTCNRRVEENETAVACDSICQRWQIPSFMC